MDERGELLFDLEMILVGLILVFIVVRLFLMPEVVVQEDFTCGDSTLPGVCSEREPYYCSEGKLVPNSTICGCPYGTITKGDSCVSRFEISGKKISLDYVLKGEKGKIDFIGYWEMANYIGEISRVIVHDRDEQPSRKDFKMKNLDEKEQRELLLPLVTEIQNLAKDKNDQVRIAISLVQMIPFGESEKIVEVGPGLNTTYSRYAYEVLYEQEGICGEKSELLAFLLRELGYGVVVFYYGPENHEAVGIRCPSKYGVGDTSYCFVETSGSSIMTNNKIKYVGGLILESEPEIILISRGDSLDEDLYEYQDGKDIIEINNAIREKGRINLVQTIKLRELNEKYYLAEYYYS